MLIVKNRNLKKLVPLVAIFVSLLSFSMGAQPVSAAAARCNNPFLAPTDNVVTCPTTSFLLIDGGTAGFKPDRCYVVKAFGSGSSQTYQWISSGGCNIAPFKAPGKDTGGLQELPDVAGGRAWVLGPRDGPQSCRIFSRWVYPIINFLGIGVGFVVTIMIVIGGIQY